MLPTKIWKSNIYARETNIFAYERGEKPICIMWNINAPTNDANFQHFKNVFYENNSEGFV